MSEDDELVERATSAVQDQLNAELCKDDMIDDVSIAKAALSAIRPGDSLPGGLVAVPEEPTAKMWDAFFGRGRAVGQTFKERVQAGYRAMIQAAKGGE